MRRSLPLHMTGQGVVELQDFSYTPHPLLYTPKTPSLRSSWIPVPPRLALFSAPGRHIGLQSNTSHTPEIQEHMGLGPKCLSSSRTTLSSVPQDLPQRGTRSFGLHWGILTLRRGTWVCGQKARSLRAPSPFLSQLTSMPSLPGFPGGPWGPGGPRGPTF